MPPRGPGIVWGHFRLPQLGVTTGVGVARVVEHPAGHRTVPHPPSRHTPDRSLPPTMSLSRVRTRMLVHGPDRVGERTQTVGAGGAHKGRGGRDGTRRLQPLLRGARSKAPRRLSLPVSLRSPTGSHSECVPPRSLGTARSPSSLPPEVDAARVQLAPSAPPSFQGTPASRGPSCTHKPDAGCCTCVRVCMSRLCVCMCVCAHTSAREEGCARVCARTSARGAGFGGQPAIPTKLVQDAVYHAGSL